MSSRRGEKKNVKNNRPFLILNKTRLISAKPHALCCSLRFVFFHSNAFQPSTIVVLFVLKTINQTWPRTCFPRSLDHVSDKANKTWLSRLVQTVTLSNEAKAVNGTCWRLKTSRLNQSWLMFQTFKRPPFGKSLSRKLQDIHNSNDVDDEAHGGQKTLDLK